MARILKNGVEYGLGGKSLIDRIYPVGSIYISTSSTFNPQTVWGGTWRKTADGKCLIGANTTYPLGTSGGSATHTHTTGAHAITQNEMTAHNHRFSRPAWGNAEYKAGSTYFCAHGWNSVSTACEGATYNVGGGAAHSHGNTGSASNMQPYLAVYIWERTA